jgi:hypothetical protein
MNYLKKILPKILFAATFLLMLKVLFLGGYPDFDVYYFGSMSKNILNYPPFVTIFFIIFSFAIILKKSKRDFSRKTLELRLILTLNLFVDGYA